MDYAEAVEKAPPGWSHFTMRDVARLREDVRRHELASVPADEPDERVLRGLFWTLVYHLEPEKWDELVSAEPIHPEIIAALPSRATTAIDVGAGSGRLTGYLAERCPEVVAVEPSDGLRAILTSRLPAVRAIGAWAEALPIEDGWSDLTAACGTFGPEPQILAELRRVTRPGGHVALVSPERPEWFEANGWRRITAPPIAALPHAGWIEGFFGPLDPPHEMVLIQVG